MNWYTFAQLPWRFYALQALAVVRLEWRRNFFSRRAVWLYVLALAPVLLTGAHSLVAAQKGWGHSLGEDLRIYAGIFHLAYLRMAIFLGCVVIFANQFRGEFLERTLHYYFLAPIRREVLVAGKYIAGLLAAIAFFAVSAGLSFLLTPLHFGAQFQEFLLRQDGLEQLGRYVLVAVLACAGYGAVFLLAGMLLRNPMIPAAGVMVWEGINPFLPSLLRKCSIIFYLKSLTPIEIAPGGPLSLFATNVEPPPVWLAVPGLLLVTVLVLVTAAIRARRLEVSYGDS
jgi:ABC-type transport system involved in multi-copper enzyme maturation permease subunit